LPTERTTGLEPRGRDFCLGLPGVGGAVPGGMADSDLAARAQRIPDRRLCPGNAPLPAWGTFLLDRRPRTKTFARFATGRLTPPKHAGGRGSKQPGPFLICQQRCALYGLARLFTTRFTLAVRLPVMEGGETREPRLDQPWASSRNRAVTSFKALDRSNTGSARNTPKSDMDLLACIQHLASLNCASHRMVARSPISRAPGPAARSRTFVDILRSLSRLS